MGRSARDMAVAAGASAAGSSFALSFVDEAGIQRREPLSSCWNVAFERVKPVRGFPLVPRAAQLAGAVVVREDR